jgi:thiol:disulfide interchange protein DsbC
MKKPKEEKMKKIFLLFTAMLLLSASDSFAFSTKGQECSKCHTLKKDEAATLLKNFDEKIKVVSINVSTAKYLFEVFVETNGKKAIVYIDFPKKYLFTGSLYQIQGKRNLTQERLSDINKVNVSQIPLSDALVLGDKSAKYKVIVFTDPECPFCAKGHQEMKKVVKERKDIAFYIKLFPLKIHPNAYDKAKAIVCEKSLTMLENSLEKKTVPAPRCKTSVVDENMKLAAKLGITGTPTLVMPDGRVISGFRDATALKELILKK